MSALKAIELELSGTRDLALISERDSSVWLAVPLRWWDLATLIWWLFAPADRKAEVRLTLGDGSKVKLKAVRVASRHVRVRGIYS
jgi:hypothetical protein